MEIVPCKGCEIRQIGCHATCAPYNDWKEKHKEMVVQVKKQMPPKIKSSSFLTIGPRSLNKKRR